MDSLGNRRLSPAGSLSGSSQASTDDMVEGHPADDGAERVPRDVAGDVVAMHHIVVDVAQDNPAADGGDDAPDPFGPALEVARGMANRIASALGVQLPSMADTKTAASQLVYGALGGIAGGPSGVALGVVVGNLLSRAQVHALDHRAGSIAITHMASVVGMVGVGLSAALEAESPTMPFTWGGATLVVDGLMTAAASHLHQIENP